MARKVWVNPRKESKGPQIFILDFSRLSMSVRSEARFHVPLHRHEEYELLIADTGTYGCAVNEEWMEFEPGEGVLVKPGDLHEDQLEEPGQYFGMGLYVRATGFDPEMANVFPKSSSPESQRFELGVDIHRNLLAQYQAAQDESDDFIGPLQESLLAVFFWQVIRSFDPAVLNPSFYEMSQTQTFPNRLQRVLRRYVHTQTTVSEIAEDMHMSESALSHTCKDLLGISPYKAFVKLKMERARDLLENSVWTIKEISNDLGFADQYAFSRTFKTHFGMAPVNWRKKSNQ